MQQEVLLIDVGNSRTKTACWSSARGVERRAAWNADQLSTAAGDFLEEPWVGAVISSVASADSMERILDALNERHVPHIVVSSELIDRLGLVSGLYAGQGADRVANVVAMTELCPLPALCVDIGTAITFDLVDDAKHYVGGLIAPGPILMTRALAEGTARLPHVEEPKGSSLLVTGTSAAISGGCWWGGIALVNGLLGLLSKKNTRWKTLVITGGLSQDYATKISFPHVVDVDITFKGMARVWQARNAGSYSR
jgi:type III pantothenate kinase